MNTSLLCFTSIMFLILLYQSRNIWLDPEAFLEINKRKRSKYSVLWSIFPNNIVAKSLDKYPKFELWYSRIVILIMYLMFGFGLALILTNSLR